MEAPKPQLRPLVPGGGVLRHMRVIFHFLFLQLDSCATVRPLEEAPVGCRELPCCIAHAIVHDTASSKVGPPREKLQGSHSASPASRSRSIQALLSINLPLSGHRHRSNQEQKQRTVSLLKLKKSGKAVVYCMSQRITKGREFARSTDQRFPARAI